jgi:TonB-dependent receptor
MSFPTAGNGIKLTNTLTVGPSFEYRWRDFTFDGTYVVSHSRNDYDNISYAGTVNNAGNANVTGLTWTAVRSGSNEADWRITQTGGTDWSNLALRTSPTVSDDTRQATNELRNLELNGSWVTPLSLPTKVFTGVKQQVYDYYWTDDRQLNIWNYTGASNWAGFESPVNIFRAGGNQLGVRFTALDGSPTAPAFANRDQAGALFRLRPDLFVRTTPSMTNYISNKYLNVRDMKETVRAGYIMGQTKVQRLQLQGGVRYEATELKTIGWDTRTDAELTASGFGSTVAADGIGRVPTTQAGADYYYSSKPRRVITQDYHDYFPSITAKYPITQNFLADLGWGKTIKRPALKDISGGIDVDTEDGVVKGPNPSLKPERATKLVGSLSYYFGKNQESNVQIVGSTVKIKNLMQDGIFDLPPGVYPEYAGYDLKAKFNYGDPVTYRSLELSYQQALSFLPRVLRGTTVDLSYTRTTATNRVAGLIPNSIKGGISYRYKAFNFGVNGIWRDEANWSTVQTGQSIGFGQTAAFNRFKRADLKFDVRAGYKITEQVSISINGRNVLGEPHRIYESSPGYADVLQRYENYGVNWSISVKGNF